MATQQERAELHKTIWKIANELRGAVDGWEFKAYVLGSIFYLQCPFYRRQQAVPEEWQQERSPA